MQTRLWTFVLLAAVTVSARAQLRLPALQVPALPLQTLSQTVDQTGRTLERLSDARHQEIARLLRAGSHQLETDPQGEPVLRGEILALSPSDAALDRARSNGFTIVREQSLAAADLRVIVLQSPANLATRRALADLRAADPDGVYDYNHIYTGSGRIDGASPHTVAPPSNPDTTGHPLIRVGLLDTGIASAHPAFRDSVVHTWGCADNLVPALHGTAVASLLLSRENADLYSADVYCGVPTGGAVDAIIGALAWLSSEGVAVINVSLVGPANALLERSIVRLVARGYLIVAAVGNDGPTAPPLYPAAYAGVIGVTGVDARHHVLLEAERGEQVMFAAPGADIKAADTGHSRVGVRGTSFAAPLVAALLAEMLATPDTPSAAAAVDALARRAIDLGLPGKDLTYGFGLVGEAPH